MTRSRILWALVVLAAVTMASAAAAIFVRPWLYPAYVPVLMVHRAGDVVFVERPDLITPEHRAHVANLLNRDGQRFELTRTSLRISRSLKQDKELLANYTRKALEQQGLTVSAAGQVYPSEERTRTKTSAAQSQTPLEELPAGARDGS